MRKIATFILPLALFSIIPGLCLTEYPWRQEFTRDGITVSTRDNDLSSFREFRAEGLVNASMEECQKILVDVNNVASWQPNCAGSWLLSVENNGTVMISYNLTDAPWPASDRDVITQSVVTTTKESITHSITAVDRPDLVPLRKGTVRIKKLEASWKLVRAGNATMVTFQARVDPGGMAPAWIVNMFGTQNPYKTLVALRRMVRK